MEYFLICICALITLWAAVEQLRDTHGNLRGALVYFLKRIIAFHKTCCRALEFLITATVYLLYLLLEVVSPSAPPKTRKIETGSRSSEAKQPSRHTHGDSHSLDRDDPPAF